MLYELAIRTDECFESLGYYPSSDQAYVAAMARGEGDYFGSPDPDSGHYEEEIHVTGENEVLVRNFGETDWSQWND